MSPFWTFCARAPPGFENEWTYSAWECSALREVHIVLDTNKTYPKRRDCLFSFNLNLDLFTLALENLYFNTLDWEKVQGKSLGCIKSLGTPHPHTPIQGATAKGWKSRMRLGSRGLPTPGLRDSSPKNVHFVIIYCPSSCSKPVSISIFCWAQKKIIWGMLVTKQLMVAIDFDGSQKTFYWNQWLPSTVILPTLWEWQNLIFFLKWT